MVSIVFPVVSQAIIVRRIRERFVRRAECVDATGDDDGAWLLCDPPRLPDVADTVRNIRAAQVHLASYAFDPRVQHVFVYNNDPACRPGPGAPRAARGASAGVPPGPAPAST